VLHLPIKKAVDDFVAQVSKKRTYLASYLALQRGLSSS
jgi:hypothetical protein